MGVASKRARWRAAKAERSKAAATRASAAKPAAAEASGCVESSAGAAASQTRAPVAKPAATEALSRVELSAGAAASQTQAPPAKPAAAEVLSRVESSAEATASRATQPHRDQARVAHMAEEASGATDKAHRAAQLDRSAERQRVKAAGEEAGALQAHEVAHTVEISGVAIYARGEAPGEAGRGDAAGEAGTSDGATGGPEGATTAHGEPNGSQRQHGRPGETPGARSVGSSAVPPGGEGAPIVAVCRHVLFATYLRGWESHQAMQIINALVTFLWVLRENSDAVYQCNVEGILTPPGAARAAMASQPTWLAARAFAARALHHTNLFRKLLRHVRDERSLPPKHSLLCAAPHKPIKKTSAQCYNDRSTALSSLSCSSHYFGRDLRRRSL